MLKAEDEENAEIIYSKIKDNDTVEEVDKSKINEEDGKNDNADDDPDWRMTTAADWGEEDITEEEAEEHQNGTSDECQTDGKRLKSSTSISDKSQKDSDSKEGSDTEQEDTTNEDKKNASSENEKEKLEKTVSFVKATSLISVT